MTLKRVSALLVSNLMLVLGLFSLCYCTAFLAVQKVSATAPRSQVASPSFVRVIHASPYVGTADVFVDGNKLLSSFAFGSVTNYASIPPGPHNVQIALVGKGINASVIRETLTVSPGVAYTVAAIGTQPTNLSLEVFVDNNILAPGKAKFRTYQLSPDAGPVTVSSGGTTLLNGITYQNASNYLEEPAGQYNLSVLSSTNNATLSTSATLNANMVASLFVVGMFNGTPKSQLVTSQTQGLPSLPNTGSDPNATPEVHAAQSLTAWTWSLIIVSLLFIGGGICLWRIIIRTR